MSKTFSFDVLSDGSLILTLEAGCLQTAARQAQRELTAALLEGCAAGTTLEALADTLGRFLSTTNFPALRAEHPELAGHTRCRVRLHRDGGAVRWELVSSR